MLFITAGRLSIRVFEGIWINMNWIFGACSFDTPVKVVMGIFEYRWMFQLLANIYKIYILLIYSFGSITFQDGGSGYQTNKRQIVFGKDYSDAYFTYFFLPLVSIGVAGRLKCLSAARRVACRSDIPWAPTVSATESLHLLLGLPLALQPECLVL